jgi:hypothetical protein
MGTSPTSKLETISRKDEGQIEVSYGVLSTHDQNYDKLLQDIATAVNLQLSLEDQHLPFIEPDGYNTAKQQDKLFIYGPSGSGKSRIIFETIKHQRQYQHQQHNTLEKFYIINPRQKIGEETGRINLDDLVDRFRENDVVIWDNFPDDLIKRDIENARKALEIISSKDVAHLLVTLKPKYLEIHKGISSNIPELYEYDITYDIEKVKSMIEAFGNNIAHFSLLYRKYISSDINKISRILWQKEPLPITILAYLRELANKERGLVSKSVEVKERYLNPVLEAEKMLHHVDYYERQLRHIIGIDERNNDAEFLYALKLCYELGINRSIEFVERLQNGIFSSIPHKDPLRKLGTWVYLSGQYYAMHDVPREAIKFSDYIKVKIVRYLTDNFTTIIPRDDNTQTYHNFGKFFGRNIHLIPRTTSMSQSHQFLPNHIYEYVKRNLYFAIGLGRGAGQIFSVLDDQFQEEILARINIDGEFAKGLSLGLGHTFSSLSRDVQTELFLFSEKNSEFAYGLGYGLGHTFSSLSRDVQTELFLFSEKNSEFAYGLGYGFASALSFKYLPGEFRNEIFKRAEKNSRLVRGLGEGIGYNLTFLDEKSKKEVFTLSKKIENLRMAWEKA